MHFRCGVKASILLHFAYVNCRGGGGLGTIFYSWQSDAPNNTNRYFLRDCLSSAIKNLNKEEHLTEALRIDQDSSGTPGMPDIAATIFNKIDNCDVFVADLSFVGESIEGKKLPNPNVLIELGYAISKLSDRRIVAIMNTEHGQPEDLPFDLKHKRYPITYGLNENELENKLILKDKKVKLIKELETAIKLILSSNDFESFSINENDLSSNSYSSLINKIKISDSRLDWEYVDSNWGSHYIYKNDVNLSMSINCEDDGIQNSNFKEKWANCYPDPKATGYWVDIRYSSTVIMRTILVSVDGARAMLPIPREADENNKLIVVTPIDFKIAEIFDADLRSLSHYFAMSKLKLGD